MATLATLMVLLLLMGMVAVLGARVLQGDQLGSEALVQGHQRQSLQESGLAWGLQLLNSPWLDKDCHPTDAAGPPYAEAMSTLDEQGRRAVRVPWQGLAFHCSADDAGTWHCSCPAPGGDPLPDAARLAPPPHFTDQRARFSLEFQGRERADAAAWHRRTLRLLVQSCAEGQVVCKLPSTPASADLPVKAQTQLVTLAPALAQAPGSSVISAATVDLRGLAVDHAGLALAPDPDSTWVVQAGGDILGAEGHLQGPPGSTPAHWIRRMEPELALAPEAFFQRFFGMPSEHYRGRRGLSALDCREVADCSPALEARVRAGHRWLWILGPLRLRSPIRLGSRDSPVLLLCDGALDIDAGVQFTGLVYSHGDARLSASGTGLRIEGAVLSAGAVQVSGQVQIVHIVPVIRRLTDLRGSWVRIPGGWAP